MDQITITEFKEALISASNYLDLNKEHVNDLNVFPVPDGDTGTNMSKTIKSAVKQVVASDATELGALAGEMSRGALMGARGNSGVILSQLFRGFAEGLKGEEKLTVPVLATAMKSASEMTYLAVMKPTEGTILTVGRESAEFAVKHAKKYSDLILFSEAVLDKEGIFGQHAESFARIKRGGCRGCRRPRPCNHYGRGTEGPERGGRVK